MFGGSGKVVGNKIVIQLEVPRDGGPDVSAAAPPVVTHSKDFAGVRWGGQTFQFNHRQRSVVAALVQARREGHDWVGQDTLLELADSDGGRLRDLFRGHPAWGTMIVSAHHTGGPVGAFRLGDPPVGGG